MIIEKISEFTPVGISFGFRYCESFEIDLTKVSLNKLTSVSLGTCFAKFIQEVLHVFTFNISKDTLKDSESIGDGHMDPVQCCFVGILVRYLDFRTECIAICPETTADFRTSTSRTYNTFLSSFVSNCCA